MLKFQKCELFQWDTNIIISAPEARFIDFSGEELIRVEVIEGEAIAPDEWFHTDGQKTIWECFADNTRREYSVYIKPRPIPPDYIDTPVKRITFDDLVLRVETAIDEFQQEADAVIADVQQKADDTVSELREEVNGVVEDLQQKVDEGYFNGKPGDPGKDGHSPYIGTDGIWYTWIDSLSRYEPTGIKAQGSDANVTAENIEAALGFIPADSELVDGKLDKPSASGKDGQVLGLDKELNPVWVDQSKGTMSGLYTEDDGKGNVRVKWQGGDS